MKLFELVLDEETDGVHMIALVDDPAIKRNFLAFKDEFVKPNAGESKDDFVKRCIPVMISEGKDADEAIATCYSMWEQTNMSHQFKVQDEEKRIVMGPIMVANLPIYRWNEDMGDHYVVFRPKVIEQAVLRFFKERRSDQANVMHDGVKVDGVYLYESFLIDDRKPTPKGFDKLPNGSWFGTFKVENDEVWERVKSGEFAGFSIEGFFGYATNDKEVSTDLLSKLLDVLKG